MKREDQEAKFETGITLSERETAGADLPDAMNLERVAITVEAK